MKLNIDEPLQMTWRMPRKSSGCRRDPAAGPGTCSHWWGGCPKASERGCYLLWAEGHRKAGNVPDGAGKAKAVQA